MISGINNILLTGSGGFVGKNLKEFFEQIIAQDFNASALNVGYYYWK